MTKSNTKKERIKQLIEGNARELVKIILEEDSAIVTAKVPNSKETEGVRKCLERKYHVIELEVKNHESVKVYIFDTTPEKKREKIMREVEGMIETIEKNFQEQRETMNCLCKILERILS